MKKILFKTVAISTIFAACFCLAAVTAQARRNVEQSKAPAQIVVTAVDTTAKTVTLQTGKDDIQVYHLTAITKITVNGKSATMEEIQKGMRADISVGGGALSKIDLTGTGTADTPTKKKKK